MKTFKKFFSVAILLGIVFFNTTCGKQKLFEDVTWEGHVYDSIGNPAKGITMTLNGCDQDPDHSAACNNPFTIGTSTTDASGHFYIKGKAARSYWYSPDISGINGYYWDSSEPVQAPVLKTSHYTDIHLQH
ncbi:MAG TPA: hypothetical protein VKG26_09980 [Bacteroidia bacterium]|nr:hypothetical protein [Bacteroidia bacterium]